MSILKTIEEWFKGKSDSQGAQPMQNQGQPLLKREPVDVVVQAQEARRDLLPIPVDIQGIVPTWQMPSKHQVWKCTSAGEVFPQELLGGDYKYSRITVWALFAGFTIGSSGDLQRSPQGGSIFGAQLPPNVPITIEGNTSHLMFVQSQASITANQNQPLYYVAERWTD